MSLGSLLEAIEMIEPSAARAVQHQPTLAEVTPEQRMAFDHLWDQLGNIDGEFGILTLDGEPCREYRAGLLAAARDPRLQELQGLRVARWPNHDSELEDYEHLLWALSGRELPGLRRCMLDGLHSVDAQANTTIGDLSGLLESAPNLEQLQAFGDVTGLTSSTSLVKLDLVVTRCRREFVASMQRSRFDRLETLILGVYDFELCSAEIAAELGRAVLPSRFPALRELVLYDVPHASAFLEQLLKHRALFDQLEFLRLGLDLDSDCVELLERYAPDLSKVGTVELGTNLMTPSKSKHLEEVITGYTSSFEKTPGPRIAPPPREFPDDPVLRETLDRPVTQLEVAVFTEEAIERSGAKTIRDLVQYNELELLEWFEFPSKSLKEIKEILAQMNVTLRYDPD